MGTFQAGKAVTGQTSTKASNMLIVVEFQERDKTIKKEVKHDRH